MKIRSGFVSNSSSSSFVFVGFPKDAIRDSTVDLKTEIMSKIGRRAIDKFAMGFFKNDSEYETYQNGNVSDEFWKAAKKHFAGDLGEYEAPNGYTVHCLYKNEESETWFGIDIAYVSDSGMDELDEKEIDKARKIIKHDYPKVTPKIILGTSC